LTNIFQKLFNREKPQYISGEVPTVPVTYEKPEDKATITPPKIQLDFPLLNVGCSRSVGLQRDHNEDALFAFTTHLASEESLHAFGLYIVADGMGGHKLGEVASGLAIRTIASYITQRLFLSLLAPKPSPPEESVQEILQGGVQDAHRVIMKEAPGSGTTLTALLILDKQMTIAHVGDSRAYALTPEGSLKVLTRDHSLVMRMMELGQLTSEEASIHPQRNVLYRALGQGEPFLPDINTFPLPESGHIMLCSDGLWGVVSENEIIRLINVSPNPQVACQYLIDAANAAGGPDNISAILIRVPD